MKKKSQTIEAYTAIIMQEFLFTFFRGDISREFHYVSAHFFVLLQLSTNSFLLCCNPLSIFFYFFYSEMRKKNYNLVIAYWIHSTVNNYNKNKREKRSKKRISLTGIWSQRIHTISYEHFAWFRYCSSKEIAQKELANRRRKKCDFEIVLFLILLWCAWTLIKCVNFDRRFLTALSNNAARCQRTYACASTKTKKTNITFSCRFWLFLHFILFDFISVR